MLEELSGWVRAFALTQIVEMPIYRVGLRVSWLRCFAASAITHPFVWFGFPRLAEATHMRWVLAAVLAEIFAWGVEALFFWRACKIPYKRAMLMSLVANGASVAMGLFLRHFFDAV